MRSFVASAAVVAVSLITGNAFAHDFGSVGMRPDSNVSMMLSPSAHDERICNGYFSTGKVVARINGGAPKTVPAGRCIDARAQTLSIDNPQGGMTHVFFGRSGRQNI